MLPLILTVLGVICVVGFIIFLTTCNSYDDFNSMPNYINISGGRSFTQLTMSFRKWKTMFELDPTKFNFVDKHGDAINLKSSEILKFQ